MTFQDVLTILDVRTRSTYKNIPVQTILYHIYYLLINWEKSAPFDIENLLLNYLFQILESRNIASFCNE